MNEYLIPITVNTLPLISDLQGRQGMFVLPDGSININKKDGTWLHINKQSDHAGILKTTDIVSVQPGIAKWYWAGPGNYSNVGSNFIIDKLGIISYDGQKWSFVNVDILSNPKQLFDPNDNLNSASMQATDKYIADNSERYFQKVIDDSIGDNQTEIVAYGIGTTYTTPANNNVWVGNKLVKKAGVLKSITINALKSENFKFAVVTIVSESIVQFTGPYIDISVQQGINTYPISGDITLEANQTLFLSLNTVGKIGYTHDSAITDCEFCQVGNTTGPDFAYSKNYGFAPWLINVEVHKGRTPFTVDQWTLKTWEDLNGGNENLDFSSTVTLDKTKSIKYTKLTSLVSFTKGNTLLLDKVCTYKLTGGSVAFSSDFLALENSKPYDPTKTNIIKFFKEYGKIRYTNEVIPLESI